MPERNSDLGEEIQRIAYHLWVLARKQDGGPQQFLQEAAQIIGRRGDYRLDAIQDALERHEKGEAPPTISEED